MTEEILFGWEIAFLITEIWVGQKVEICEGSKYWGKIWNLEKYWW